MRKTLASRLCFGLFLFLLCLSCALYAEDTQQIQYERVVVIAPAIAEMMESLDLDQYIVGRGQYGPWSQQLQSLPVVGGYNNPNAERVIDLQATIVINSYSQAAAHSHQALRQIGVEVIELDTSTIEGIYQSLKLLGERFHKEEMAESLLDDIKESLRQIKLMAKKAPRKSVLFVVGMEPLYVAGPESHIDYLISLVGGNNIIDVHKVSYQQISMETIIQHQPEIIIDTSSQKKLYGQHLGDWQQWQTLPAVINNKVYHIDPSRLLLPGVHLQAMALLMGKLIQPELFGKPDEEDFHKIAQ